jgi:hypothetical protein
MAGEKKSSSKVLWVVLGLFAILLLCGLGVGIGAAVGIPAFVDYQQRAKTAEAEANLASLYHAAAAYYAEERLVRTVASSPSSPTRCTVASAITSNSPGPERTVLDWTVEPESFGALGFVIADPVYYQYEIVSVGGCDHSPGTPLYSFRAHGDLDGDGVRSTFELSAGSDANGELYRAPGIYRVNELE